MDKGKISDLGKEIVIMIKLPGVKKEDLEVNYGEDFVEISASKKTEISKESENAYISQKVFKKFYRKIKLPSKIIPEKANHNLIEGLLQIIAPKKN